MPRKTDTRDKILSYAAKLILERGYNAFSYHDISEKLGIKNAAVHYHFPSKSDLGLKVIESFSDSYSDMEQRFAQKYQSNDLAHFNAYLDIYEQYLKRGKRLCPLSILGAEYFSLPPDMQKASKKLEKQTRQWLSRILENGKRSQEFSFQGDSASKAMYINAALMGSLQASRVTGRNHFYDTIKQIKNELVSESLLVDEMSAHQVS